MSHLNGKTEQLNEAISAFELSLEDLPDGKSSDYLKKLIAVLNSRVLVAETLSNMFPVPSDALIRLSKLDTLLKRKAHEIDGAIGMSEIAALSDALQQPATGWWWHYDKYEMKGPSLWWTLLTALLMVVSLTVIHEIVLKAFSGGSNFLNPSEILLAVLTAGTLAEVVRRIVQRIFDRFSVRKSLQAPLKMGFAFLLLVAVLIARFSLPAIAKQYNGEGIRLRLDNHYVAALKSFERAVNLDPTSATAHYNLGNTYEDLAEPDKAMIHYRQAIENDAKMYLAYNNLARLYIVHKNEPANALPLLERGLEIIETLAEADRMRAEYTLLKNKGWAYVNMNILGPAEEDLRQALQLRSNGAAANCLLAKVLETAKHQGNDQEIATAWLACLENAPGQELELDPHWLEQAQQYVKQGAKS